MHQDHKIYVAGHRGMVGAAIVKALKEQGYHRLVVRSSTELDLRDTSAVAEFFCAEKPDYVFLAAAKVGGIHANNTYRGAFLYDNLMIQNNVIHQAYLSGVKKLLFLGSSCIYPKFASQPIQEDALLSGFLEPTNEPYALAKITGIKMVDAYRHQYNCDFISAMPTNLYGPNDNYHLENSHVIPAMIRKFNDAKTTGVPPVLWGSGTPKREFMHVYDLASACIFLMHRYSQYGHINVGTGEEVSIRELAEKIQSVVGYHGEVMYDTSMPDGTPRKLMDVNKLHTLGWKHQISLDEGLKTVYQQYVSSQESLRLN